MAAGNPRWPRRLQHDGTGARAAARVVERRRTRVPKNKRYRGLIFAFATEGSAMRIASPETYAHNGRTIIGDLGRFTLWLPLAVHSTAVVPFSCNDRARRELRARRACAARRADGHLFRVDSGSQMTAAYLELRCSRCSLGAAHGRSVTQPEQRTLKGCGGSHGRRGRVSGAAGRVVSRLRRTRLWRRSGRRWREWS